MTTLYSRLQLYQTSYENSKASNKCQVDKTEQLIYHNARFFYFIDEKIEAQAK